MTAGLAAGLGEGSQVVGPALGRFRKPTLPALPALSRKRIEPGEGSREEAPGALIVCTIPEF